LVLHFLPGEVLGGTMIGDFHMTPGFVGVQEYEQIRRAIAPVLAIVPGRLPGYGRNRLTHLADQLRRALIETHDGILWIGGFRIEISADGGFEIAAREDRRP
jgi:hypothetical protein